MHPHYAAPYNVAHYTWRPRLYSIYYKLLFTHDCVAPLLRHHTSMSEGQQQSWNEYSFEIATVPNTVPPVPPTQATMPGNCAVSSPPELSLRSRKLTTCPFQIRPAPEIPQDDIFVSAPSVHPAYYEPHRVGYPQYYGPITSVSLFRKTLPSPKS